jgi:hypothetical protein
MINPGRPLIVIALAWPIPAVGAFLDANDLYARCDVPSNTRQMNICAAYVEGVVDALTSTKALCPPDNLAATRVIDIVMKHLRQHPEARPYAAASEAEISLLAAFPCKNSN